MNYIYTKDDPHWVQATRVQAAVPDGSYVNVWFNDQSWMMKRAGWSNPFFDKTKSDCLVQDDEGSWLKAWWYDADVETYQQKQ